MGIGYKDNCRLANKEEKDILIYALKEEANSGNKNAIKVLEEVFNIGPVIRTYEDLILYNKPIQGAYITSAGVISSKNTLASLSTMNIAISTKVAKSMLAMAMISQLIPYYGGEITDEEWNDTNISKYTICKENNEILSIISYSIFHYLAFHTEEQRDEFLKYNKQLVKDYLMID
jgi:hypothetical protein